MKLILAIVNNDDAYSVNTALSEAGFPVTKISSTGGFLMNGNSTFLLGVPDEAVDRVMEVVSAHSRKREQTVPVQHLPHNMGASFHPQTVTVGGATVFVLNVEDCRRL